jgi:hypothetical protein
MSTQTFLFVGDSITDDGRTLNADLPLGAGHPWRGA